MPNAGRTDRGRTGGLDHGRGRGGGRGRESSKDGERAAVRYGTGPAAEEAVWAPCPHGARPIPGAPDGDSAHKAPLFHPRSQFALVGAAL